MAKPGPRVLVQDKEMKEIAAEIHLGLYTLTKIYKTTQDFDKCFQQVKFASPALFWFGHCILNFCFIGILMMPLDFSMFQAKTVLNSS